MGLLWTWTVAMAVPTLSTLAELEEGQGACSEGDDSHLAGVPVHLDAPALVYVRASAWDRAPVQLGLAQPAVGLCHGAALAHEPEARLADGELPVARWLPAGEHRVELSAAGPTSAVVEVGVVTVADLESWGVPSAVAEAALHAADHAWTERAAQRSTLAIIDFSRPSTLERIWVVDLLDEELRHHLLLTHGKGSGSRSDPRRAVRFSNTPFSNQSSLGLFVAAETYIGSNGRSMRLDGLEPEVNDLARDRQIVFHGAEYARMDHIAEWGYLGRSHGCPAVDDRIAQVLIDELHSGGLLYAWYPDRTFFGRSEVLR